MKSVDCSAVRFCLEIHLWEKPLIPLSFALAPITHSLSANGLAFSRRGCACEKRVILRLQNVSNGPYKCGIPPSQTQLDGFQGPHQRVWNSLSRKCLPSE
ncbi:hypothetical protein ANANG_G00051680 [Anguilla anguilla]|uniref:Uncharacterized protein n=1 Tax=Anguilla anguilla TaxID=7936 RepID=A0A9D3MXL5_ANGAN|nr:hypothetical protein ANANG_G00051680 [Anguilla anguilla]